MPSPIVPLGSKVLFHPRVFCALLGLGLAIAVSLTRFGELVDLQLSNLLFKSLGTRFDPTSELVLVSLERGTGGEESWDSRLSQLLEKTRSAATVALDALVYQSNTEKSRQLGEAIQRAGNVVVAGVFQNQIANQPDLSIFPRGLAPAIPPYDYLFSQFFVPDMGLARLSRGAGHSTFQPALDHLVRRYHYFMSTDEGKVPSLVVAAVKTLSHRGGYPEGSALHKLPPRSEMFFAEPRELVYYRKPFTMYTAEQVLSGQVPAGWSDGRMVIVGFEGEGSRAAWATPIGAETPTWIIHATALSNWIQRCWILNLGEGRSLALSCLFGILPALVWSDRLRAAAVHLVALLLFYQIITLAAFYWVPLRLPWAGPMIAFNLAFLYRALDEFLKERRMRVRLEEIQVSRRMFASMLLHDLNTPVNNMVMLLESIAEKLPDAKSAQRVARAITEGKRANRMLGTLLDIERIEAQKLELNRRPIEWKHLVQLVIRSLEDRAEQKKLGVVCETSNLESDFRLMCDEMLMERVLVNLVENAVQHADPGTRIEIRNEIQRQGNRRVLVCGVLNEGPAISAAEQEKLFGLFAQVRKDDLNEKREGFGLGIFFCKLALEAHGGAIRCVSPVPGKETGVMFEFRLPLDEPAN